MAKLKLTWDKQGRWKKEFRGVTYRISCSALHLPESEWTKEKSYAAALEWWNKKHATIILEQDANHPNALAIAETERRLDYAIRHSLTDEVIQLKQHLQEIKTGEDFSRMLPFESRKMVSLIWADRLKREAQIIKAKTVGEVITVRISQLVTQAKAGLRSESDADNWKHCLSHFAEFVGESTDINSINAKTWQDFYYHMLAKAGSVKYNQKCFTYARRFLQWCFSSEITDTAIRNLNDKFRFNGGDNGVNYFTVEETKAILKVVKGRVRLWVLLCLNCAYTQQDLSDLRISEVDLERGVITRKRSKMKATSESTGKDKGITLQYKLWEETIELMKLYPPTDSTYYFSTRKGHRLVEFSEKSRSDNTKYVFKQLYAKHKIKGSFGRFRKTVGKLLRYGVDGQSRRFYSVAQQYLGQKSQEIIDKHYAGQAEIVPHDAIDFIRQALLVEQTQPKKVKKVKQV